MTEFDGSQGGSHDPPLLVYSHIFFQFWPCVPRYRLPRRGRPLLRTAFNLPPISAAPIQVLLVEQRSAHRCTIALPNYTVVAAEEMKTGTATINAASPEG